MLTIKLNDFNFKNEDAALLWVDTLYIKYDVPHGYKKILKTLATNGYVQVSSEQSLIIYNILKHEGIPTVETELNLQQRI